MCFDMSFEIVIVVGMARIEDIRIVVKMMIMVGVDTCVIWEMAKAAPVRDFWKRNNVRKDVAMTNVLIEPRSIRNCSRLILRVISDAMIAAWLEPSPGKKEQIGEMKIVARVGLINSFLFIFSFAISCLGITTLDLMEWIRVEVPKSPVRSGRRGWDMLRLEDANPRNPARKKIIRAFSFPFFWL